MDPICINSQSITKLSCIEGYVYHHKVMTALSWQDRRGYNYFSLNGRSGKVSRRKVRFSCVCHLCPLRLWAQVLSALLVHLKKFYIVLFVVESLTMNIHLFL